jgi:hypothetical protein
MGKTINMIQILPVAKILHEEILLEDDFNNKFEGWELIEDEDEHAFIKDSYYWMENKSVYRWMFYHKKLPLHPEENFMIKAEVELLNTKKIYGQFGLVWGFDKQHNELNKFVKSVYNNDFTIAKYQKDHAYKKHRFSGSIEQQQIESTNKHYFSIVKLGDYYYFYLNPYGRPVYITHVSQMSMEGNRFGFYVEPGILMRCDKIVVKRLITDKHFNGQVWMPLDDHEMPLGSQILSGN